MSLRLFLILFWVFFISFSQVSAEEEEKVKPFPPLEKISVEEASKDVIISFERLKFKLQEYMNSTPLRREVKRNIEQLIVDIKRAYNIFIKDPRKFLEGVGIKDQVLINQIVSFVEEKNRISPWHEEKGISARILSCSAPDSFGNVTSGIQISVPRPNFLRFEGLSSPSIDFGKSTNISDIKNYSIFPKVFNLYEDKLTGYNSTFILPFTFKAKDLSKPVKIDALFKGVLCQTMEKRCRNLEFTLNKDIYINVNSFPAECEAVKDALQQASPNKHLKISKAVITPENELKIEVEANKEPYNPNLLVLSPPGLNLSTPAIAYTNNKILFISEPNNLLKNLEGSTIRIIVGSPYNFIEEEITLKKEDFIPYRGSSSILNALMSGFLLPFFSPIVILLLFLLTSKADKKSFITVSIESGLTISFLYPLLRLMTPFSWGEQFMQGEQIFFSIVLMLISSLFLVHFKGFKGSGIVFALLALLTPCHYLQGLINQGNLLAFCISGFISGIILFSFSKILKKLPNFSRFSFLVFIPVIVFSVFMMLIIMIETSSWLGFTISTISLFLAFCALYRAFYKKESKAFFVTFIFLLCGFIFLSPKQEEINNNFSQSKLEEALKKHQIVYVYTDLPWCISCKIGRFMLSYDPTFSDLKKRDKLVIFSTSWENKDLEKYRSLFKKSNPPLNLIFGDQARSGIEAPRIMFDYEVSQLVKKVE